LNHRDTEDTEEDARRGSEINHYVLFPFSVFSVSLWFNLL